MVRFTYSGHPYYHITNRAAHAIIISQFIAGSIRQSGAVGFPVYMY